MDKIFENIPWDRLGEGTIIAIVVGGILFYSLKLYIESTEKTILEKLRVENETKQKELEDYKVVLLEQIKNETLQKQNEINIKISEIESQVKNIKVNIEGSNEIENSDIGNQTGKSSKTEIDIKNGSKIKDSRIGVVNA